MSLTKDWEYKITPFIELIEQEAWKYDMWEDDGEFHDKIQELLCKFVESIEECSNFDADTQLYNVVRQLTTRKTEKDLLSWQGKK